MTACAICEHDPDRVPLAVWEWEVGHELASLNKHRQNDSRGWDYRKDRDTWTTLMRSARAASRIPAPTERRRVLFTRLYTGREREWDSDNLIGGLKAVRDAMERAGLVLSDARRWMLCHYAQERSTRRGLRVRLEELGAP